MQPESSYHVPVLFNEAIDALNIQPNGVYVDCTFGGGGHAKGILEKLSEAGRLIAFDQDADAQQNIQADERLIFVPHNFRHLQRFLKLHQYENVNGVLADLGVSSFQFNEAERGFSTRFNGPLDMRMDKRTEKTAAQVLMQYSEPQLHKLFEQYGEVSNSKTLARHIVQQRGTMPLKDIASFKLMLQPVVKGNPNKYFAQVFQALRIEVNDEMGALNEMLGQLPGVLLPHARVAIITFHSIEDRIVKNFFKQAGTSEDENNPFSTAQKQTVFKTVYKKPVTPGEEELKRNPRSRSAKLRVAEKI
ncbi:16S rRNA (cytosine(1402)-N(4))-methyltransferase RsmH [Parafilimonas terrae]|uniref:Ribosomal RNA small subunit methyltransferase H n=1 Tax=Parafilimonas terrae TaxID=1465490 RepID=A0A1I5Z9W0_9BACT|nr:16S rRNA (cytosine(1402)-N(4))-methyltransferase RsmH [Parafilimonas terrae]SFQ53233.1 16S rRNA (cytosine1402-N4)-methyltransferase [Parafilimonas terrae]